MIIENIKKKGPDRFLNLDQISGNIGNGTQESPFLITSSKNLPEYLRIKNSLYHIHIKNCNFNLLILKKCQYIRLFDCTFESLQLEKDSHIEIVKCHFNNNLSMRNCLRNSVINSSITRFDIINSYENFIENSKIDEAFNTYSSGNTFKNLQIPDKYIEYLLRNKLMNKTLSIIVPIIILIMLFSTIRLYNLDQVAALWGISMMSLALSFISIISFISFIKMRKYGPNRLV